jgi:hypothetical protein
MHTQEQHQKLFHNDSLADNPLPGKFRVMHEINHNRDWETNTGPNNSFPVMRTTSVGCPPLFV